MAKQIVAFYSYDYNNKSVDTNKIFQYNYALLSFIIMFFIDLISNSE